LIFGDLTPCPWCIIPRGGQDGDDSGDGDADPDPDSDGFIGDSYVGPNIPEEHQIWYYHGDHLGSSTVITDRFGRNYEHLQYFPYGETWVEEKRSQTNLPFRFTGKELDPETGLYYFGARYYDPVVGVWVSPDPIDRFGPHSPPTGLNLYQYALLNPIRLIDPTGLNEEEGQKLFYGEFKDNVVKKAGEVSGGIIEQARNFAHTDGREKRILEASGETEAGISGNEERIKNTSAAIGEAVAKSAESATSTAIEAGENYSAVKAFSFAGKLGIVGKRTTEIKEAIGIYKKNSAGKPYSTVTGQFVKHEKTLQGKIDKIGAKLSSSTGGQAAIGFTQGFTSGYTGVPAPPAGSRPNEIGQNVGQIFGQFAGYFN
jgi:RHS repeat-associated protein